MKDREGLNDVEAVLERLTTLLEAEAGKPAMVIMAPDQGTFILGNKGGFLHLAIAAVKAAEGEEQDFEGADWVYQNDFDWQITGLRPDPGAHAYLPMNPQGGRNSVPTSSADSLFCYSSRYSSLACIRSATPF